MTLLSIKRLFYTTTEAKSRRAVETPTRSKVDSRPRQLEWTPHRGSEGVLPFLALAGPVCREGGGAEG